MGMESPQTIRLLMAERERLFSYIWAIVGDAHLAEDVFQEVSLFVIEKRPDASDDVSFRVWLRRTARFKAIEALRRSRREVIPLDESVLDSLETHWVHYDANAESDLIDLLKECMKSLTPNGQNIIGLRYVEGLRSREIAQRLGRQVDTVYRSIARAHRALMECVRSKLAAKTADRNHG